ncbi:MAG: hypothetical protein IIY15_02375 [Flavobacteriales bacterium]|nr:hypothetical protein [Flavobacteriales bacterium]
MAEKEITVEQKLRTLYDLQLIDSRIDQIRAIQGELPLEVQDLEDEIEGLNTRLGRLTEDYQKAEENLKALKKAIIESKDAIIRYETQQKSVRNNREYDALRGEIEYEELNITHAEKLIREASVKIEAHKANIALTEEKIQTLGGKLSVKQSELDGILAETQREMESLQEKADEISAQIEPRLLTAYRKIRARVHNGLAVVSIDRGASEGSYFTIPAQRQIEIAMRKKIIADENSGRILVDPVLAAEEREKMAPLFANFEI